MRDLNTEELGLVYGAGGKSKKGGRCGGGSKSKKSKSKKSKKCKSKSKKSKSKKSRKYC